jgi:Putative beta-barrel porin-2, OmpL-like. bbp2
MRHYLLMTHFLSARLLLLSVLSAAAAIAQEPTERERQLLERIRILEERMGALEARVGTPQQTAVPQAAPHAPAADAQQQPVPAVLAGTTVNLLLDGYYEYNFNRPVGRINLLRPFDPTSNNFTLSQGLVVIERAPDPANGRRWGARLDLMFGQTTEGLSGNPLNEPRSAPYRNLYQAFGTYVVPLGSGLNVDFGRFASSLGFEGTLAKDQLNYTRSLLFTALPAYHMGFRSAYKINDKVTATWLLVNGINQTEDFNGFKSNHFMLTAALTKTFSWTGSYYIGEENRDLNPVAPSNLPPSIPTQPGLSTDPVVPRPNGKTHIADTYFTWNVTPKLTAVGEGDYIVNRVFSNSHPVDLSGGAGYLKYQFVPAFSLTGRFEYLSDRGGFLSGATQALKEGTLTAAYQPADGFQIRWEFRQDYSDHPFFFTETPGVLRKRQNTALIGLLWWFGAKQGAW